MYMTSTRLRCLQEGILCNLQCATMAAMEDIEGIETYIQHAKEVKIAQISAVLQHYSSQ